MKLVRSNGRALEVRDVGEVLYSLSAEAGIPLPILDNIMDENAARDLLRQLRATGYKGGRQ
jgi:hypothetical protein